MKDYHINIFYSEDDECYVADIPDLQYCSAFGDTPEEAAREITIAKELWLEVAAESGTEIPKPMYSPIIYKFRKGASDGRYMY
jgi:predicted RNase H-like HicB family nuclease